MSDPNRIAHEKEILDLKNEVTRWKRIAFWLADCHAANLHIAELKSCSKSERRRLKNIMTKAQGYLEGKESPKQPPHGDLDRHLHDVMNRLEDHARRVPETD